MKAYLCGPFGYVFLDELYVLGEKEETPDDWICPICFYRNDEFTEMNNM